MPVAVMEVWAMHMFMRQGDVSMDMRMGPYLRITVVSMMQIIVGMLVGMLPGFMLVQMTVFLA